MLEAARQLNKRKSVRVYQASASEMFGDVTRSPRRPVGSHALYPRSPYACAKVFAFHQTVNYREAYDLFACNGILFNHESPRRGETFVTRKITRRLPAASKRAFRKNCTWAISEAKRDWGYAKEYVEAMWLMPAGRRAPVTTSSPRMKRTPSANSSKSPFESLGL